DEVDSNAFCFGMYDRRDVASARERLTLIRVQQRCVRNCVDAANRVAGPNGIRNLLSAFDTRHQIVANAMRCEPCAYLCLIPQDAFYTLRLDLISVDLCDLVRGSPRSVRAGDSTVVRQ